MKTKLQLLLVTLALAALSATAQVPGIISHQGKVTVNGTNYTGSGQFKFALVDAAGTNTYWSNDGSSSGGAEPTNAVTLATARGVFSVNLGDTNVANMTQAIPADAFTNSAVYLRTWFNDGVDGSQLLTPDRQITSVGYALVAANFTGTLSLAQLPTGVVTNNETDVNLTGTFTGNGVGSFNGDGSGLTGLDAGQLTGTVPLPQLPADMLINYASGVNLTGTFTGEGSGSFNGDGSGLTDLDATQLTGVISLEQLPAGVLINGGDASGDYSTALGDSTTASGYASTALGSYTTASGDYSTATGDGTEASGYYSTALGYGTTASGDYSTAMGRSTTASGSVSTAMGNNAQATNDNSFVWSDGFGGYFTSTTNNEFSVRAAGGVRFVTGGAGLTVDGQRVLTNGGSMTGSFTGNGAGLTNIPAAAVVAPPPGMALIPAGSFTMGNSVAADTDITDATPISTTVSAFYMDVNLVSLSQWQSVYYWATDHGYGFVNAGAGKAANHPVQTVDWYDCVKWCNARSQQAGKTPVYYTDAGFTQVYTNSEVATLYPNWTASGYRLPTEAEWEKAARGGVSGQRFPWGNVINQNLANYYGVTASYAYDLGPNGYNPIGNSGTSPVGSFAANGYGIYDMAGNVLEQCWDWYGTPYGQPTNTNPTGPATGSYRVLRGGSWNYNAGFARCAFRDYNNPNYTYVFFGFRCVSGL